MAIRRPESSVAMDKNLPVESDSLPTARVTQNLPRDSKTTDQIHDEHSNLPNSFETKVKEFFHFSRRTSKAPGNGSSKAEKGTAEATSKPMLRSHSKEPYNADYSEDEEVDIKDSEVFLAQLENEGSFNTRAWKFFANKEAEMDKESHIPTSSDTGQNLATKVTEMVESTMKDNQVKGKEKVRLLLNDLDGTPSTVINQGAHHLEESKNTWDYNSGVERPPNRVTATKIPYHKLTLPPRKPLYRGRENPRYPHSSEDNDPHQGSSIARSRSFDTNQEGVESESEQLPQPQRQVSGPIEGRELNPTDPSLFATRSEWRTALMTLFNNVADKNNFDMEDYQELFRGKYPHNDLFIPQSILNFTPDNEEEAVRVHSSSQSARPFATGQFQTAREHISLVDEEINRITLKTKTTTTTTPEPRLTRKPETFTIGGLLHKGKGDFYQTIVRNPKLVLATPPGPNTNKGGGKYHSVKSVTWATVKPPKELVLNARAISNGGKRDNLAKFQNPLGRDSDQKYSELDLHKELLESRKRLLKNGPIDENIALQKGTQTVRRKQATRLQTTVTSTRAPQKTAIVQNKAKSANKDIMWGECRRGRRS